MTSHCKHGIDARFCAICAPRNPQPVSSRPPLYSKSHFPHSTTCEVFTVNAWTEVSVDEARARRAVGTRCIQCKQPVVARAAGENGSVAHFAHCEHNPFCSRSDQRRLIDFRDWKQPAPDWATGEE
jgi:hypothetical protein